MGFNQNQDTLKTFGLLVFLIVIELIFICSSFIVAMAYGDTGELPSFVNPDYLDINEFTWHDWGVAWHYTGVFIFPEIIPGGYYEDIDGHIFYCKDYELQDRIDKYNKNIDENINSYNAMDFVNIIITGVTFNYIPSPYNVIPIVINIIIWSFIGILTYSEIKTWIDSVVPG